ncbi:MAG: alpha-L-arabinofuranosidase C-terminal domain-containing protein [Eubacteriales bacterium]|nr:alpha-L-arabinofuranosidase C-terminal domain-containing protein [Eubacteriales bacterium]
MSKLIINKEQRKSFINRNIYGHFSEHLGRCIYNGLFVGEDSEIPNNKGMRSDVVEALRKIKVPVLRWPGGCFADEYHWKDGIGPKEQRKKMINTHWGGVVEDNSFGTHEFLELCEQIGCEPYINGNVGSGTVQEMSEWVEYLTFDGVSPMAQLRAENGREKPWKVKYFGVGNENWGCGGNMRPEYYADLYRRFQTYVRNYGDNKVFKIACGPNVDDYNWTDKVMASAAPFMDALTLHFYTFPGKWFEKQPALGFEKETYYETLKRTCYMNELIENHSRIMSRHDPENRVGLIVDEWGTWFKVEPGTNPGFLYQQNTMRDAMVAALNLNIFNRHSDRVIMANIAQLVNVLQAPILTEGDKMVLTPTYHVFDLYQGHQDATLIDSYVESTVAGTEKFNLPALDVSTSVNNQGVVHVTIANISADDAQQIDCPFALDGKNISARILRGNINDYNDFEEQNRVRVENYTGIRVDENGFSFLMPACSIMEIVIG